jgi:hypothetical protein
MVPSLFNFAKRIMLSKEYGKYSSKSSLETSKDGHQESIKVFMH